MKAGRFRGDRHYLFKASSWRCHRCEPDKRDLAPLIQQLLAQLRPRRGAGASPASRAAAAQIRRVLPPALPLSGAILSASRALLEGTALALQHCEGASLTLMKRSLCVLPIVRAGACLIALAAGTACSAARQPAARSANSSPAVAPEPNASASVAAASPGVDAQKGFHLVDFVGLGRGDRIADLGPGGGYSIAPFAEAVGPFGAVYVRHDPRTLQALPSQQGSDVTESAIPTNVIRMDTPLEAPFSPEAKNLDYVTLLFTYHDLVAEGRDRHGFNAAVFHALKPGGGYIVVEHAPRPKAEPGAGQDGSRVDAAVVRADVEAVGFRFVEAADFFTPPAAGPAGTERTAETSQYVLKFQKPGLR